MTIQRAIQDVAETVSRMREFYRQREPQNVLGRVQLNSLVKQAIELTRPRWSDMQQERGLVVRIETRLADDLPEIMGAESEIRDALTNLVFNAVDAMPEGGTLTVATRAQPRASAADESTRQVYLEVSDTGIGMDEETRRRCLEPFFTTKGERGTRVNRQNAGAARPARCPQQRELPRRVAPSTFFCHCARASRHLDATQSCCVRGSVVRDRVEYLAGFVLGVALQEVDDGGLQAGLGYPPRP